ncbi:MAG: N-acetylmuramoyl-L-alanine amidase [Alphaproteobacteria bacterium]
MRTEIISHPSPNCEDRPSGQTVDTLIIHYTGMQSYQAALRNMCDPAAKVSAHYMVGRNGLRYRLVDEERRAWHAGMASWQGAADINDRSIGIELVNPGHEWGYIPFPAAQMASLEALIFDILERHPIPAERILGHSDVAPLRKQDPGELFDWQGLSEIGLGVWPGADTPADTVPAPDDVGAIQTLLRRFGYACPDTGRLDDETRAVILAFQRHFQPEATGLPPDPEMCRRLADLAQRFGAP